MALYNVFLPGVDLSGDADIQNNIAGGLSAAPLSGTLLQGVTASGVANALTVLSGALNYNFEQATHVYLQSADNLD